jgi:hypothetical protein
MKTKIISKIVLTLGLALVLNSAVTPVHGGTPPSAASVIGPSDQQLPIVTIHSASAAGINGSAVRRGQIGAFVLSVQSQSLLAATTGVNFKVGGTAIPGVDYVPLVSPAFIGQSGFGVILVRTLPDPRASAVHQAYTVTVTLEPGPGYVVGQPSAAKISIEP